MRRLPLPDIAGELRDHERVKAMTGQFKSTNDVGDSPAQADRNASPLGVESPNAATRDAMVEARNLIRDDGAHIRSVDTLISQLGEPSDQGLVLFSLDEDRFRKFNVMLDAHVQANPDLARLLAVKAPWKTGK